MFSYNKVLRQIKSPNQICDTHCVCDKYKDFVYSNCEHVITGDLQILENSTFITGRRDRDVQTEMAFSDQKMKKKFFRKLFLDRKVLIKPQNTRRQQKTACLYDLYNFYKLSGRAL